VTARRTYLSNGHSSDKIPPFSRGDTVTSDGQALHDIVKRIETGWNSHDSKSIAAVFAENANFIKIVGGQLDWRPAIEASRKRICVSIYKRSIASFVVRVVRLIRPDVAIVFVPEHVNFLEGN
jgi:uncharacterized protein (TIGR02246 family)